MKNAWTEEIERLRAVNKELEEACKIALPFLQEYRERVIKGRIEGELKYGRKNNVASMPLLRIGRNYQSKGGRNDRRS